MSRQRTFYPLPPELHAEMGIREYVGFAIASGFGVFLIIQGINSVAARDWLRAAFCMSSGLVFVGSLLLIWASVVGRRRITIDGATLQSAGGSLVVPWSRQYYYAMSLFMGALVPAGSILSIGVWTGALDIVLTAGQAGVFSIIGLPLAIFAAGNMLTHVSMKKTRSFTVSPRELTFPGVLALQRTVRWVDVKSVEMGPSTLGNAVIHLEVRRSGGQKNVKRAIYAERFSIGAAATFQLLRFYHNHPQLRDELADHRAAERVLSYGLVDVGSTMTDAEPNSW